MSKIDKFYEAKNLFQCPKCKKKIRFHGGALVCKKEHTFDIAAKGYVNLLQQTMLKIHRFPFQCQRSFRGV